MRVLFVEDNPDVRELIFMLLEEEGLEVVACSSGEAAEIEFAKGRFDLLLTDISLPGISGTELARRVLQKQADAWIVFSSGYAMAGGLRSWGPRVRYLLKPFEAEDLHLLMEEVRASVA